MYDGSCTHARWLIQKLTRFAWKLRCENKNGGGAGDFSGCVTTLLFSYIFLEQTLIRRIRLTRQRSPKPLRAFVANCNSSVAYNDGCICITPIFAYFEACSSAELQDRVYNNKCILTPTQPKFAFRSFIKKNHWFILHVHASSIVLNICSVFPWPNGVIDSALMSCVCKFDVDRMRWQHICNPTCFWVMCFLILDSVCKFFSFVQHFRAPILPDNINKFKCVPLVKLTPKYDTK